MVAIIKRLFTKKASLTIAQDKFIKRWRAAAPNPKAEVADAFGGMPDADAMAALMKLRERRLS